MSHPLGCLDWTAAAAAPHSGSSPLTQYCCIVARLVRSGSLLEQQIRLSYLDGGIYTFDARENTFSVLKVLFFRAQVLFISVKILFLSVDLLFLSVDLFFFSVDF
jgi:hypothetical protein